LATYDRSRQKKEERDRVQPINNEAEQAVIGGLLLNPNSWDDISFLIGEEDFYKPATNVFFRLSAISHFAASLLIRLPFRTHWPPGQNLKLLAVSPISPK